MALLIALLLVNTWAYTLTDQVEPDVLTLRTQEGSFRVRPNQESFGCEFLTANQNVLIVGENLLSPEVLVGWSPVCEVEVLGQVDEWPCFMNEAGDCDVRIENGAD